MIEKYEIHVPPQVEKEQLSAYHLKLKFTSGFMLELKVPAGLCATEIDKDKIKVTCMKKRKKETKSVVHTWQNLIQKYAKNPLFVYTVTPVFKYFPMVCSVENDTIQVTNYMGLKAPFRIKIKDFQILKMVKKQIRVESYNDINTGSDLNKLKALRYKTYHRKLDRRVFSDGFHIEKIVRYK